MRLGRHLLEKVKSRREAYHKSEAFYFKQFIKAARHQDFDSATTELYRWLDHLALQEPSVRAFARAYGSDTLRRQVEAIELAVSAGKEATLDIHEWKSARQSMLKQQHSEGGPRPDRWINP